MSSHAAILHGQRFSRVIYRRGVYELTRKDCRHAASTDTTVGTALQSTMHESTRHICPRASVTLRPSGACPYSNAAVSTTDLFLHHQGTVRDLQGTPVSHIPHPIVTSTTRTRAHRKMPSPPNCTPRRLPVQDPDDAGPIPPTEYLVQRDAIYRDPTKRAGAEGILRVHRRATM